jgi:hypothetical protein
MLHPATHERHSMIVMAKCLRFAPTFDSYPSAHCLTVMKRIDVSTSRDEDSSAH